MSSIELTPHRAWAPEVHLSSLAVIRVTAVTPPQRICQSSPVSPSPCPTQADNAPQAAVVSHKQPAGGWGGKEL